MGKNNFLNPGMSAIFSKFLFLAVLLFSSAFANSSEGVIDVPQNDPEKMVIALSKNVVNQLNLRREKMESDPTQVKLFATEVVLPYIDTMRMARYVLGKNWRTASKKQQDDFVNAFTNTLIRSYSQSLLKLEIDSVDVKPARIEKAGRVTIPSSVNQKDGNETDVSYWAYLNKKTQKWMLYDFSVQGISMLLNYRKAYDSEISKKGLSTVIKEMQEKNFDFNGQSS